MFVPYSNHTSESSLQSRKTCWCLSVVLCIIHICTHLCATQWLSSLQWRLSARMIRGDPEKLKGYQRSLSIPAASACCPLYMTLLIASVRLGGTNILSIGQGRYCVSCVCMQHLYTCVFQIL